MNSLQIREFSQSIINFINENPLPLEIKRLAVKDIYQQISEASEKQIYQELEEKKKEKESEVEKDGEN